MECMAFQYPKAFAGQGDMKLGSKVFATKVGDGLLGCGRGDGNLLFAIKWVIRTPLWSDRRARTNLA